MADKALFLAFGETSIEKYSYINTQVFNGELSNRDLFMLALSFGLSLDMEVPKFKKSATGPRTELSEVDDALFTALYLVKTSTSILDMDIKDRNETLMGWAEVGIAHLFNVLSDQRVKNRELLFLEILQSLVTEFGK